MNRDEIMDMQPGRELDVVVAEKVMGYTGLYLMSEFLKPYSTDISAAWEVVEKLRKTHWVDISGGLKYELVSPYSCQIGAYGVPGSLYADGDTAPEAICRAALLSLIQEDKPND